MKKNTNTNFPLGTVSANGLAPQDAAEVSAGTVKTKFGSCIYLSDRCFNG